MRGIVLIGGSKMGAEVRDDLSYEEVANLLSYYPDTGEFEWKNIEGRGGSRRKHGRFRGCLDNGYLHIGIRRKRYKAHRLAWLLSYQEWPEYVDHINGDRSDNKLANLRSVSWTVNSRNKRLYSTNTSKAHGVSWRKDRSKWQVRMHIGGKKTHYGYFDSYDAACALRRELEKVHEFHHNHGAVLPSS